MKSILKLKALHKSYCNRKIFYRILKSNSLKLYNISLKLKGSNNKNCKKLNIITYSIKNSIKYLPNIQKL